MTRSLNLDQRFFYFGDLERCPDTESGPDIPSTGQWDFHMTNFAYVRFRIWSREWVSTNQRRDISYHHYTTSKSRCLLTSHLSSACPRLLRFRLCLENYLALKTFNSRLIEG